MRKSGPWAVVSCGFLTATGGNARESKSKDKQERRESLKPQGQRGANCEERVPAPVPVPGGQREIRGQWRTPSVGGYARGETLADMGLGTGFGAGVWIGVMRSAIEVMMRGGDADVSHQSVHLCCLGGIGVCCIVIMAIPSSTPFQCGPGSP